MPKVRGSISVRRVNFEPSKTEVRFIPFGRESLNELAKIFSVYKIQGFVFFLSNKVFIEIMDYRQIVAGLGLKFNLENVLFFVEFRNSTRFLIKRCF